MRVTVRSRGARRRGAQGLDGLVILGVMSSPGEIIRQYLEAARAGDWDAAFGFYADDVVFRIPGRSAFAGEHRGLPAAKAYIAAARELAHGSDGDVTVELVDVLEGRERVALLVRERFPRPEGEVEIRRANVYRIAGGRIAEVWIFEADQYEVDALFASGGSGAPDA